MRRIRPHLVALGALSATTVAVAVVVVGTPSSPSGRERFVTVSRGVVQSTVSGSGNLEPIRQSNVSFKTSGTVAHVYVSAGEHVVKGELLATLDDTDAEATLAAAEASLAAAKSGDSGSDARSSTTASTAAVETNSSTAVAASVANGGSTTTTTNSTTTTPQTTTTTTPQSPPTETTPTETTPQTTTVPSQPSSATGSSGTNSAESSSPSEPAAASSSSNQAAIAAAEADVEQAEADLAATRLHAPMAGTVAEVNGAAGDTVSAASASSSSSSAAPESTNSSSSSSGLVVIANLRRYQIDVSLTESDIGKVRRGQSATVTVNAASGEQFAAHVAAVAVLPDSSSSTTSSAVSYPVTLVLDQSGRKLKAGMSASADVVVSQASGLVVPTQALTGSSVTVVRNGKRSTQTVTTGVAGDATTLVLSGLQSGDQVVMRPATITAAGSGSSQASSPGGFGAFGGGGRGGGFGGGGFPTGGPPGGAP